jgi:mersacidin/lichenicidin family type 2 lantibiotic
MAKDVLVRAWKDEVFRLSLSEAERALLPENPAGNMELTDAELDQVTGGSDKCGSINCFFTVIICGGSFICAGTFCGVTIIV